MIAGEGCSALVQFCLQYMATIIVYKGKGLNVPVNIYTCMVCNPSVHVGADMPRVKNLN